MTTQWRNHVQFFMATSFWWISKWFKIVGRNWLTINNQPIVIVLGWHYFSVNIIILMSLLYSYITMLSPKLFFTQCYNEIEIIFAIYIIMNIFYLIWPIKYTLQKKYSMSFMQFHLHHSIMIMIGANTVRKLNRPTSPMTWNRRQYCAYVTVERMEAWAALGHVNLET